jgi:hypothetical protein
MGGTLWQAMMEEPGDATGETSEAAPQVAQTEPDEKPAPVDETPAEEETETSPEPEPDEVEIDEQGILRSSSPEFSKTAAVFSLVHRWIPDRELIRRAYRAVAERGMPMEEALSRLDLALHEFRDMDFETLRLLNLPTALEYYRPGDEAASMALVIRVNDEFFVLSDPVKGGFLSTNTEFPHRWTGRAWLVVPTDQVYPGVLDRDSNSLAVIMLEKRLARLGYLDDIADGQFSRRTARAVKEFQEDYHLVRTGDADVGTQALLFSMTSEFVLPTLELQVDERES